MTLGGLGAHSAKSSSSATFTLQRERVAAAKADCLLRGREIHVGDADRRTLLGEELRRLAPDPARGARDHAHLAVESPSSITPPSR